MSDVKLEMAYKTIATMETELAALREELANTSESHEAMRADLIATDARLTAAEQRNAELAELLDSAFFRLDTFIEAEREMPIPSMEVLRDAILRHCPALKPTESGASE